MKIKIIVNPAAGGGRPLKVIKKVLNCFQKFGFSPETELTKAPKHATSIAFEAVNKGYEVVVALGGDGTISEVANGLAGSSTLLGVIPAGSGNDFFKMLNLPNKISTICRKIFQKKFLEVDLGEVFENEKFKFYFINSIGTGFAGETAGLLKRNSKQNGFLAYLTAVFKIFFKAKPVKVYLKTENLSLERNTFMVAIGNGHSMGGGFKLTPFAEISDNLLDICVVDYLPPFKLLPHLPKAIIGTHYKLPFVKLLKSKEIFIESPLPVAVHFDGEISKFTNLNVKISKTKLRVIGEQQKNGKRLFFRP